MTAHVPPVTRQAAPPSTTSRHASRADTAAAVPTLLRVCNPYGPGSATVNGLVLLRRARTGDWGGGACRTVRR